jgi:hypothetical protein
MSIPPAVRIAGWTAVALLFLSAGLWGSVVGRPAIPAQPTAEEIGQIARSEPDELPNLLTALATRLGKSGSVSQIVVVQVVPDGPPVVAANTTDSDGDEEPTYWPVPWPAVVKALQSPITEPRVVAGSYVGVNYRHWLAPLEPTGTRCLLVNSAAPAPRWWGYRGGLLLLAGILGAILLVGRGDGS